MKREILGSKFRLTRKAYEYIKETISYAKSQPEVTDHLPVISWMSLDSSDEDFIPGPTMALDNRDPSDLCSEHFYLVEKIKVFIILDEYRTQECLDKILDYRHGRLVLIHEDDFIDQ